MEPKQNPPPNYGFQTGPPAYDQHQNFPQHPEHPQGQHGPQVVTVITTNAFGPDPATMHCPSCRQQISSRVDFETSTKTHLMAALVCLLFWPCFWIPYTVDSCKNANHYCPSCGCYLGRYSG